jgi:hypothetical protein
MVEFGRFAILADGRPIMLSGRAFDVPMALIEASGRWSNGQQGRALEPRPARQDRRSEPAVGAQDCSAAQGFQRRPLPHPDG